MNLNKALFSILLTAIIFSSGCIQQSPENSNQESPTDSKTSVSQETEPLGQPSKPAHLTTEPNKLKNKATPNSKVNIKSQETQNSILLEAVTEQDFEGVKTALVNGADVNAMNPAGITALMFATINENLDIFKVLLEAGADVNLESGEGETALMYAAGTGHFEMTQMLIEKGADINAQDSGDVGTTALIRATAGGHTEVVRLLLGKGADVINQTLSGDTALTIAQDNGYTEIVELINIAQTRWENDSSKVSQNTKPPTFDDYPVDPVNLKNHAPIDFDSHPDASKYRDALKAGIKNGPNFAQHYTIVAIGCGTLCEVLAIVDAYTGAVYFPEVSEAGQDFRIDSNLLIVNPPQNIDLISMPPSIEPHYFIWKNEQLLPIE